YFQLLPPGDCNDKNHIQIICVAGFHDSDVGEHVRAEEFEARAGATCRACTTRSAGATCGTCAARGASATHGSGLAGTHRNAGTDDSDAHDGGRGGTHHNGR
ncbi:MAG TPA: hypothetical protein VKR61_20345, partial [Bryobacteraceae bacterium]|nr:hypothetical protein [Bryobacteraceae bacterium]